MRVDTTTIGRGRRSGSLMGLALLTTFGLAACGGDPELGDDPYGEPATEEMAPGEMPPADRGAAAPEGAYVPAGTTLTFEVTETVSTQSHDEGDEFELRLVSGVTGENGAELPAGTRATGAVAVAHESTGADDEAALLVSIESIEVNGDDAEVETTVESATTETSTRDSATRTAATIATGAAAGAVIGQILGGDTRSTVGGAAVGAAIGAGVAITTRGGHAVLPEGSQITVRLAEPLPIRP